MNYRYDIFISYSRRNFDRVKKLKNEIESSTGTHCWMDLYGIECGTPIFTKAIIRAINACPIFLFMLSEESQKSDNALKELDFAYKKHREEGKKVVIVYIENCKMSDEFSFDYGKADTINWKDTMQHDKLIRDLRMWTSHFDDSLHQETTTAEDNSVKGRRLSEFQRSGYKKPIGIACGVLLFVGIVYATVLLVNNPPSSKNDTPQVLTEQVQNKPYVPIDLGLPSGTMWCDRNIGAKTASDFGEMYAWGETKPKKDYSQGLYDVNSKPTDRISSVEYDVATKVLGEEWALPTEKQFKELLDECKWVWKQIDGHYGYEVIGKNGNKIFLPAGGRIGATSVDHQNKYGYYWTTDRILSYPRCAWNLQFPVNGKAIVDKGYLYCGRSIRAVYSIAVAAD